MASDDPELGDIFESLPLGTRSRLLSLQRQVLQRLAEAPATDMSFQRAWIMGRWWPRLVRHRHYSDVDKVAHRRTQVVIALGGPLSAALLGAALPQLGTSWMAWTLRGAAFMATLGTIIATALSGAFRWGERWGANRVAGLELEAAGWKYTWDGNLETFHNTVCSILDKYRDDYSAKVMSD